MGTVFGALYPLTGIVSNKAAQVVLGVLMFDMIRAKTEGNVGLFTVDDVVKDIVTDIQGGKVDRKQMLDRLSGLLLDTYFILKTPTMKAQMAQMAEVNPLLKDLLKQNPDEVQKIILEIAGTKDPEPLTREPESKLQKEPIRSSKSPLGFELDNLRTQYERYYGDMDIDIRPKAADDLLLKIRETEEKVALEISAREAGIPLSGSVAGTAYKPK